MVRKESLEKSYYFTLIVTDVTTLWNIKNYDKRTMQKVSVRIFNVLKYNEPEAMIW